MSNDSPLNAINVFEVSARLGSFQKAARELCVTPGAVSRQIKRLEDFVGKKLFKRRSRKVELTTAGRIYFSRIEGSMDVLHKATREIQSADYKEVLNVETPLTFAMHWLIPRINEFQRQFPKIDLRITTSSDPILVHRDTDLYIRRDPNQFSGLNASSFLSESSLLVCNPDVLAAIRSDPDFQLCSLPLIMTRSRQDLWPKLFRELKININSVEIQKIFDNTVLAIQAALNGIGIALIPELFLGQYFRDGKLIQLPDTPKITTGAYYYLESPLNTPTGASVFSAWLKRGHT